MNEDFSEQARDLALVIGDAYENIITLYDPEDVIIAAEDLVAEIQRCVESMGQRITHQNPTEDYDR